MLPSKFIYIFLYFALFSVAHSYSQEKTEVIEDVIVSEGLLISDEDIDPLSPSRAAFYSAVLPGLGQAYNKKYWKIPIVYAALGVSTYAYIYNNNNYNRARNAYKLSKSGKPHEFDGSDGGVVLSDETLEGIQKSYKEDRDLSLLITVGIYALQIVEASVNAHLLQLNTIDNIGFAPVLYIDPITNKSVAGASFTINF